VRELFSYDPATGLLSRRVRTSKSTQVGEIAGNVAADGYRRLQIDNATHTAHRIVWLHQTGSLPTMMIDHIDGDRDNNRMENLRDVTHGENCQNLRKPLTNNKLGVLGVSPYGERFRAVIAVNGVTTKIGAFKTVQEAYAAYIEAKRRLHPANTL
jgi:hypothetical protein